MTFKFETLSVWQKAIDYADAMLDIAESLPREYRYNIADQLIRAALSIPNNIAEGNGRRGVVESKNFYNIAKGSAYETVNVLVLLERRGLLGTEDYRRRYQEAEELCRMLSGLMKGQSHE